MMWIVPDAAFTICTLQTLTLARDYAAAVQKPFPKIDDKILEEKDWPRDCYVFEGKEKEPTIVFLPLFNRNNCKGLFSTLLHNVAPIYRVIKTNLVWEYLTSQSRTSNSFFSFFLHFVVLYPNEKKYLKNWILFTLNTNHIDYTTSNFMMISVGPNLAM